MKNEPFNDEGNPYCQCIICGKVHELRKLKACHSCGELLCDVCEISYNENPYCSETCIEKQKSTEPDMDLDKTISSQTTFWNYSITLNAEKISILTTEKITDEIIAELKNSAKSFDGSNIYGFVEPILTSHGYLLLGETFSNINLTL